VSEATENKIKQVKLLLEDALSLAKSGSYAHHIEAESLRSHLEELQVLSSLEDGTGGYEVLDFRFIADSFSAGSMPLATISKASNEIRRLIGHAALRFVHGGIDRKRVPAEVYSDLDLRLAGLLPGSSRLLVVAAANRDLLDDGMAKGAIERVFSVLNSESFGEEFIERTMDLGPLAAKRLREVLRIARVHNGASELTWSYRGTQLNTWFGDIDRVNSMTNALEMTEIEESTVQTLFGSIELLSKRERIHLREATGQLTKILFPMRMLSEVSELHLGQEVRLRCQVTATENPATEERTTYVELLEIESH